MKKTLRLLLLSTLLTTYSFGAEDNYAKFLTNIGVENFCTSVSKLKKVKSIADVSSLDYELRHFFKHIKPWYFFDQEDFKNSLIGKLKESFTVSEISILTESFKRPFMLKVLNNSILYRDIFSFNQNAIDETYEITDLVKSRYALIQNIYLLHGMEIQKDYLLGLLQKTIDQGQLLVKVVKGDKIETLYVDPVQLKIRLKDPRGFIIKDFAKDLAGFRHYELREYIRILKGDKLAQKFVQIYANFHFLYLSKYINKVETDKLNQLKTIK